MSWVKLSGVVIVGLILFLAILSLTKFSASQNQNLRLINTTISLTHACSYYSIYSKDIGKDLKTFDISKIKEVHGKLKEIWIEVLLNKSYEVEVPIYDTCFNLVEINTTNATNAVEINTTNITKTTKSVCEALGCLDYNETHCNCSYLCVVDYLKETRYKDEWVTYRAYKVDKGELKLKEVKDFSKEKFPKIGDYYSVRICGDYDFEATPNGWGVAIEHIPTYLGVEYSTYDWWNGSWQYRRPITINNTQLSDELTNFRVKVSINTTELYNANKLRSDCGDVRFTWYNSTSGNEIEISYWNSTVCNISGGNTSYWIKVPEIPASSYTTIFIYYGNSEVTSQSNKSAVCFGGESEGYCWLYNNDFSNNYTGLDIENVDPSCDFSVSVTNGYLEIITSLSTAGSCPARITLTNDKIIDDFYYEYDWEDTDDGTRIESVLDLWRTNSTYNGEGYRAYGSTWYGAGASSIQVWYNSQWVTIAQSNGNFDGIGSGWKHTKGRVNGTSLFWEVSDSIVRTHSATDGNYSSGYFAIQPSNYNGGTRGTTYYRIDNLKVRDYADPEPTYSIGEEESYGLMITLTSPTNTTYHTNQIWINGTTSDYANITWSEDGGANKTACMNCTYFANLTTLSSGSHYVTVYAVNYSNALQQVSKTVYFTIDLYPTWSQNSTNSTLNGTPVLHKVLWEDDLGLSGYIFQFCNGTWDGVNCGGTGTNWWNFSYLKRREIIINNTQNSDSLSNYQVSVNITYDSEMQEDFSDIRFVSGSQKLPYWIEKKVDGSWAKVWVKVPSIPASGTTSIYVYYKNTTPVTSESNATEVFESVIDGLVGAWHFDEGDGTTVYDTSGNDNDGTIHNAVWEENGKFGSCLSFDGSGDYVDIPDDSTLQLSSSLTVVAWFKPDNQGTVDHDVICVKGSNVGWGANFNWRVLQRTTSTYTWGVGQSDGTEAWFNGGTVYANSWQFVALTADGSNCRAYEGYSGSLSQVNSRSCVAPYKTFSGYNVQIGGHSYTNNRWVSGEIDEVFIFNKALSQSELNVLFQNYGYTTENYPNKVLVKKFTDPEPTYEVGDEETPSFWINDTWQPLSGTQDWVEVVKVVNETVNATIAWKVYVNDTGNNWNETPIFTYKTTSAVLQIISFNATNSYRVNETITVQGTDFYLGGQPYKFLGMSTYYLVDYATNHTYDDDGNEINNSRQYVLEVLDEMKYLNLNMLRTWAFEACGYANHSYSVWDCDKVGGHYNAFVKYSPGNYSDEMFEALDWLVYEASKRDIRLILVLVNNWNDYGGMRWWVQTASSTDKTYENITDTTNDNYWLFHDQFYSNSEVKQNFKDYLTYFMNRTNPYTGYKYSEEPTIAFWELANEPRAKSDGDGSQGLIKNWAKEMFEHLLENCSVVQPITIGMEGWGTPWEGTKFIEDHNYSNVNFTSFNVNPYQWDWFAERSEHETDLDWADEGWNTTKVIDWWTNKSSLTWNNRWETDYQPNYDPNLGRHGYKDWVRQHTYWSEVNLSKPAMIGELLYPLSSGKVATDGDKATYDLRVRFFNQTAINFFENGGDGILFWVLTHDDYYWTTCPTSYCGKMDDGFAFYISNNETLKNKSKPVLDVVKYLVDSGYVRVLNNYKYDFTFDVSKSPSEYFTNATLIVKNLTDTTWSDWMRVKTNTSEIVEGNNTISYQFDIALCANGCVYTREAYALVEVCTNLNCVNSSQIHLILRTANISVTLNSPIGDTFINKDKVNISFELASDIDVSYCKLFVNGTEEMVMFSPKPGIHTFTYTPSVRNAFFTYCVECLDVDDNSITKESNFTFIGSPRYSDISIDVPSVYDPNWVSKFNITWTDMAGYSIDTAFLEANFTGDFVNYTMDLIDPYISSEEKKGVYHYNITGLLPGTYQYRFLANASDGVWNSTDTFYFTIEKLITIDFNYQNPADISSINVYNTNLNISYNITVYGGTMDKALLYYKTTSFSPCWIIENGTCVYSTYTSLSYTSNISNSYLWILYPDQVYPGIYNFDEDYMRNTPHQAYDLDNANDYIKVRLFNVSNITQYNYLSIMANTTSTTSMRIYYCNSSYTSGKPHTSPYCVNFFNLYNSYNYNATVNQSFYYLVPFAVNNTTGETEGDIKITPTSYFLFRGNIGTDTWKVWYITNVSREDTVQISTNGGTSWSNFDGTVDMHLHQYYGNDKFWYYACANATDGTTNCTSERQDLIDLYGLPPTSPHVYSPTEGVYSGLITINYTESISPNSYPIVKYNITLVDLNESYVQTITSDNGLNLSYVWDSSEAPDGQYYIRVYAYDNQGQFSYGLSENITIDNTPPLWRNQGQTHSKIKYKGYNSLYAQGFDSTGLDYAWLETNETGEWENKTGVYGSPMNMNDTINTWIWSNFTWQNPSIPPGTVVSWRIYYNDTAGNENVTDAMFFEIGQYYEKPVNQSVSPTGIVERVTSVFRDWSEEVNVADIPSRLSNLGRKTYETISLTIDLFRKSVLERIATLVASIVAIPSRVGAFLRTLYIPETHTQSSLNDSSTAKNLTFTGDQNITVWIRLPQKVKVLDAKLNLSGFTVYNYSYAYTGAFINPLNYVDDDWDTFTSISGVDTTYETNYSLPFVPTEVIWKVKVKRGNTTDSYSFNLTCYNYTSQSYWVLANETDMGDPDIPITFNFSITGGCLNQNLSFKVFHYWSGSADRTPYLYEEEISLNYSYNPWIDVGDSGPPWEWNYSGEFNESFSPQQVDLNSTLINEWLKTCVPDANGNCDLPIKIHSDTAGKIEISNINITYIRYGLIFDFVSRQVLRIREVLQSVSLAVEVLRSVAVKRISEAFVFITDFVYKQVHRLREVLQPLSLTIEVLRSVVVKRINDALVFITAIPSRLIHIIRSNLAQISVDSIASRVVSVLREISEALSLSALQQKLAYIYRTLSETIQIDMFVRTLIHKILEASVTISSVASRLLSAMRTIAAKFAIDVVITVVPPLLRIFTLPVPPYGLFAYLTRVDVLLALLLSLISISVVSIIFMWRKREEYYEHPIERFFKRIKKKIKKIKSK